MGISIKLDSSLPLVNSLNQSNKRMLSSMEKLSSGLRINRASDGPAQLIISEKLRSSIASLAQEIENKEFQITRYETGSSAAFELRGQLTELRTMAVEASNEGFNDATAQAAIDNAAQQLISNYNDSIGSAEFNGSNLLDGSTNALASIPELSGIDMSIPAAASESIAKIDEAVSKVDSVLMELGSTQRYELEAGVRNLRNTHQNLVAAESLIRDVDVAAEFSDYLGEMIKLRMTTALLAHSAISSQNVVELLKP